MTLLAGADSGGTKTVAAVADGERELVRRAGAGAAVRPGRAMSAAATIARVVRSALNAAGKLRADALVVGAAGVGREDERQALRNAVRIEDLADRLSVVTDLEVALAAVPDAGPAIVLLAGTGSVAAARSAQGVVTRQGGLGWQMGDEGSGYALGCAALRAVGRAADGRGPATALTDGLIEVTRSRDFRALVGWAAGADAGEVAALAEPVLRMADAGDGTAIEIVREQARQLAALVPPLVDALGEGAPVWLGGGLLGNACYHAHVAESLAPLAVPVRPGPLDSVTGALRLARDLAAG